MDHSIDKQELAELLAVLSSAVDRADRDRIASCYTEDSFDDHGTFKGTGQQFADFVCGSGPMSSMHHLIGQSVFDVEGDEAWGETFYVFHGTVGATGVTGHGRYVDYFRRIRGAWKLAYRRVVPDGVPAGDDADAYWQPTHGRDDPSYDRHRSPGGSSAAEEQAPQSP
jgi:ketosteroid isomerase-like protein